MKVFFYDGRKDEGKFMCDCHIDGALLYKYEGDTVMRVLDDFEEHHNRVYGALYDVDDFFIDRIDRIYGPEMERIAICYHGIDRVWAYVLKWSVTPKKMTLISNGRHVD